MVENNRAVTDIAADGKQVERRPYAPPRLQRLGSVRELTLGGTGSEADPGGTPPNLFAQLGRRRRR